MVTRLLLWIPTRPSTLIIVTGLLVIMADVADCLQCWHCISDDCGEDPSDNYKASKKQCGLGQSCQKVYFEMYSPQDKRPYSSTVRSCASGCQLKDDFLNCSTVIKESRGCIRKSCCHDKDLCNASVRNRTSMLITMATPLGLTLIHLWHAVSRVTLY